MRVFVGGPRNRRLLAVVAGVCALCMASTCWQWHGTRSRLLSLDQAVHAAESGYPDAVHGVYLRLVEAQRELAALAQRNDAVGERARALLDLSRRKQ